MPYKEKPIEKLYYTIGEVAEILGEPVSSVRYWENEFDILKPSKNKKGNRLFTPADLKNIKIIHHLLKEEGMTLAGAKKRMKENPQNAEYKHEVRESLLNIKELLVNLKDTM